MQIYQIKNYEDYELHYSKEVQLIYSLKRKKYLKFNKNRDGYLQVSLSKNGKRKYLLLHRLVWLCLKGDIPTNLEINHIDEVKTNNCIENLELVTHLENMRHGTRTERAAKAISIANKISMIGKHNNPKKPVVAVKNDLSEILQYPSIMEASRDKDKGFHQGAISACCNNRKSFNSHKDFIWFYKEDFDSYLTRFNNNLEEVIKYKLSL